MAMPQTWICRKPGSILTTLPIGVLPDRAPSLHAEPVAYPNKTGRLRESARLTPKIFPARNDFGRLSDEHHGKKFCTVPRALGQTTKDDRLAVFIPAREPRPYTRRQRPKAIRLSYTG
jgi:hypothetical protein